MSIYSRLGLPRFNCTLLKEQVKVAKIEVVSEVTGSVWKIECELGDSIDEGDVVMILESMKMEIPIESPVSGIVHKLLVAPGDSVEEDQVLCVIET